MSENDVKCNGFIMSVNDRGYSPPHTIYCGHYPIDSQVGFSYTSGTKLETEYV